MLVTGQGPNSSSTPDHPLSRYAECVGGPGLAAICRLLADDHGGWGGGMPDLLLWSPERRQAKLSEASAGRQGDASAHMHRHD